MITPQTLKGFRDFLPEDARKRQYALDIIKKTFESFGFEPLETPAVEYLETFSGSIGEDEQLFFKFEDAGGRKVALRYDQTVPTCRVIAQYPEKIKLPFKRYQIQTVWRAEKPQKGRYREFLQCDADIFGVEARTADAETIALTIQCYKNLGFKKPIALINDRALYQDIPYKAIVAIDKLGKIGDEGVIAELITKDYSETAARTLLDSVKNLKPNQDLKTIFTYLDTYGFKDNYRFIPTLARSFSYSTGTIWEIVDENFSAGSLAGCERYDGLVSRFSDRVVPAVGFAIGFDRTVLAMEELGLLPLQLIKTHAMVSVFSPDLLPQSLKITKTLRDSGLNIDLYPDPSKKIGQQLKFASEKQIPFVIIIGDEEAKNNTLVLKNMSTTTQETLNIKDITSIVNKITARDTSSQ